MTDQQVLSAYLDGELPPAVARQVAERLNTDPGLRPGLKQEYYRLQQVSAVLQVRCEADPGFLVRHRQRREELSPILQWTWRQLGYRLAAVAATMLIAAGVSVWQAGTPETDTLADTAAVAEELDVLAFEGQILGGEILGGESPVAPDFESLAAAGPTEEPVLLIALGAGFAPSGER
jgi:anti-sigma factor RsiW